MYQQLECEQAEAILGQLGLKVIFVSKGEVPTYLDENGKDTVPTFEVFGENRATEDLRELTSALLAQLQNKARGATAIYVRDFTLQQGPQIGYYIQLHAALVRREEDLNETIDFEALILSCKQVNFGIAMEALKAGYRVRRESWDESTFIYLVPGSEFTVNRAPLMGIYPEGTRIEYAPHIDIKTGDNYCQVWQVSQDAILAEDWTLCMRGA